MRSHGIPQRWTSHLDRDAQVEFAIIQYMCVYGAPVNWNANPLAALLMEVS